MVQVATVSKDASGKPSVAASPDTTSTLVPAYLAASRTGSATTLRARSWPRSGARRVRPPGRSSEPEAGVPRGERQRVPGQLRRPAYRARPVSHLSLRAQQHRAIMSIERGRGGVLQGGAHLV